MKLTPLSKTHEQNGAKMVEFAGYYMPIQFSGINEEHENVRTKLGVFDVSHMGEFWVKGPNAYDLLQYVTSNDISKLSDGKIQYTYFPNEKGGIVDDFLVYRIDAETYLLVVNAANIEKDWNWITSHNKFNATLYNASDEISQLAVQGPLALKALQKLTSEPIEDMTYYTFKKIDFAGVKDVIFSITGYTGSGGCEIYFANEDALTIYNAVMEAGKEYGIMPIGLAARDTLRLEMGFCLYGNDIDETTSPIAAGLGWVTKFTDEKEFINKAQLLKDKTEGTAQKLIAFELIDKGIPRHGYDVVDENGKIIGKVTSGTMGPSVKKGIGLAYVDKDFAKVGNNIYISVRNKPLLAEIVKLPFYKS